MTYIVTAEPDGRFWCVRVPAIERVTQARNTQEIPIMAKELIELMTGAADAEVTIEFVLPADVQGHLANADRLRIEEDAARRAAARELRAAAKALRGQHLSYHDVGAVLGVSHQRAHQLING